MTARKAPKSGTRREGRSPGVHDPAVRSVKGIASELSGEQILAKAIAGDGPGGALASDRREPEDDLAQLGRIAETVQLVAPPYDPGTLARLVHHNNTLGPCIEAMEVNEAGSGWVIEPLKPDEAGLDGTPADPEVAEVEEPEDDPARPGFQEPPKPKEKPRAQVQAEEEVRRFTSFFEQPWPTMSWTTIRRRLRRDLETTGNAYLEVIRDAQNRVVFARHLDAVRMRLLRLDDPVDVEKTVLRDGVAEKATVSMRERRFVQIVGQSYVYFKEFGASRDLDKRSGRWMTEPGRDGNPGKTLTGDGAPSDPAAANEVIHFTVKKDDQSPYGVPRWIGQLPSVLGSRKAEEYNLEYLDSGGIPPMLILVSGGMVAEEAATELRNHLQARGKARVSAIIMEAYATEGALNETNRVELKVERFGQERLKDSLFENYDKRCQERVRIAFRLPPLFLGLADDYSFASVYASYLVAEAQVFSPEREEFDEIVNSTLMASLEAKRVRLRSLPLTVHDVEHKLTAIQAAWKGQAIEADEFVDQLNEAAGLEMEASEKASVMSQLDVVMRRMDAAGREQELTNQPDEEGRLPPVKPPFGGSPSDGVRKGEVPHRGIAKLAYDVAAALERGLRAPAERAEFERIAHLVKALAPEERALFRGMLAVASYGDVSADPDGAIRAADCAYAVIEASVG